MAAGPPAGPDTLTGRLAAGAAAIGALRHGGVSLRLNAGVPATQVAEWAGHSVDVLLTIYATCIHGRDQVWFASIDRVIRPDDHQ